MKKNTLKAGHKLVIYVPEGQGEYYSKLNKMSFAEKQRSLKKQPVVAPTPKLASAVKTPQVETTEEQKVPETAPQGADLTLAAKDSVKEPVEKDTETVKTTAAKPKSDFVYYTVRKGDSLWSITKKYPGVTDKEIMKINNIRSPKSLKVGQKLKIKSKS